MSQSLELPSSRTLSWDVSTLTLPDAFERYLAGMADLYEVSGVSEEDRRNFFNVTRTTLNRSGAIGEGRSVRQTLARGPATLRRSDIDGLNILINRTAVVGDCEGRSVNARPGALQFRDMGRRSTSRLDSVDLMTLLVPRHLVPQALLRPDVHGLALPPEAPGVRLINAQMTTLIDLWWSRLILLVPRSPSGDPNSRRCKAPFAGPRPNTWKAASIR